MIPVHPRTYAGLPVHFLDYTMPPLVLGQVKARDHNLPMPLQSAAYLANHSPYQTTPSRCLDQAASPSRAAVVLHLASSSVAEYFPVYPTVPRYWYPVPELG